MCIICRCWQRVTVYDSDDNEVRECAVGCAPLCVRGFSTSKMAPTEWSIEPICCFIAANAVVSAFWELQRERGDDVRTVFVAVLFRTRFSLYTFAFDELLCSKVFIYSVLWWHPLLPNSCLLFSPSFGLRFRWWFTSILICARLSDSDRVSHLLLRSDPAPWDCWVWWLFGLLFLGRFVSPFCMLPTFLIFSSPLLL